MNIIIFGPQGSGKGTQTEILSNKFNIPHISTGVIFREHIKKQTKLGKKIASIINNGDLVPGEIIDPIIRKRLQRSDVKNGFILDGYPRDPAQAKYLNSITSLNYALEIWISDKTSLKRISSRRSCPKCGDVYHLVSRAPKNNNICDHCNTELIIRDDDQPKAIKQRLKIYHNQTEPLIEYYKNKKIFYQVSGEKSISQVTDEILKIIK